MLGTLSGGWLIVDLMSNSGDYKFRFHIMGRMAFPKKVNMYTF